MRENTDQDNSEYGHFSREKWEKNCEKNGKSGVLVYQNSHTAPKIMFSNKEFFSKCDQIRRKLRIWSHLLKQSLMENFVFCAVSHVQKYRKATT